MSGPSGAVLRKLIRGSFYFIYRLRLLDRFRVAVRAMSGMAEMDVRATLYSK